MRDGGTTAAERNARIERMAATLRRALLRACPRVLEQAREDLVQAALLKVLEHERRESEEVRSASYLWKVAFSVVADELQRRRRSELLMPVQSDPDVLPEPAAAARDPQLAEAIRDCLERLSEPRRLAVTLHLEGFGSEEAAGVLGWDHKRVRNLIFRGMADLRACLAAKELP